MREASSHTSTAWQALPECILSDHGQGHFSSHMTLRGLLRQGCAGCPTRSHSLPSHQQRAPCTPKLVCLFAPRPGSGKFPSFTDETPERPTCHQCHLNLDGESPGPCLFRYGEAGAEAGKRGPAIWLITESDSRLGRAGGISLVGRGQRDRRRA